VWNSAWPSLTGQVQWSWSLLPLKTPWTGWSCHATCLASCVEYSSLTTSTRCVLFACRMSRWGRRWCRHSGLACGSCPASDLDGPEVMKLITAGHIRDSCVLRDLSVLSQVSQPQTTCQPVSVTTSLGNLEKYGKPYLHLIHNCRYLYLNTDICTLITDICNWNRDIFNLITDICNCVHNYRCL